MAGGTTNSVPTCSLICSPSAPKRHQDAYGTCGRLCRQSRTQVLGTDLNCSESTRRFWRGRDRKKRQLFYRRGPLKVIEIIRTPQIVLNRPVAARCSPLSPIQNNSDLAQGPQG